MSLLFTAEERKRLVELHTKLKALAGDSMQPDDERLVRDYIQRALLSGNISRDAFGLNPLLCDAETALLIAEEIGLSRGAVLGILLNMVVMSASITLDEVRKDFGEDVAHILGGLLRIRDLYTKSATVQSENFRSLLVTFAEDMRVILIMIANRVHIMRSIKDTQNVEAQREVSMEAAYLYAPLAHKLGLYKLKSELEDLSLKYLEHDAYYHIK
ncbi:MAG: bifunctional (p)ppGpp synthetase/guanosine-3',5'-bis(diphosphate) 3'-pyrophosphohydrolase, partial [Bacteroidaceae bacterium]|nr:bifunctional (p)ppGpp synthetase/guanosine-3',5'-bis(diphosphate) 3'-pyrophosphohydrolase [Bacteroidaceae bacterium]